MKGILQLIRQVSPKNVMLVHGEYRKMKSLQRKIECELALKCYCPPNKQHLIIEPWKYIPIKVNRSDIYPSKSLKQVNKLNGHLIISKKSSINNNNNNNNTSYDMEFMNDTQSDNICTLLNVTKHEVCFDLFCCFVPPHLNHIGSEQASLKWLYDSIKRNLCDDYSVILKTNIIEIYEQNNNNNDNIKKIVNSCVTVYVERIQNIKKTEEHKTMDIDDNNKNKNKLNKLHKHESNIRVKIAYPHNLTDTAALVQSLVNVTCDSYC